MSAITFHISICARRETRDSWGDTQYVQGLSQALRDLGHDTRTLYLGEDPASDGPRDVLLRVVGPHLDPPVPGMASLLWMISPPNLAPVPVLKRFDRVFLASQRLIADLAPFGIAAEYLPQATDTTHFHPGKADGAPLPAVFVGNLASRAPRQIVSELLHAGMDLHIWGDGWDGIVPKANWHGTRLDYDELAAVYARARVVVNSHQPQMGSAGMMSNRSYDALASGAAVLSDLVRNFHTGDLTDLHICAPGEAADTLRRLLDQPDSPEQRQTRAARIREGYSFAARARLFVDAAEQALRDRAAAASRPRATPGTGAPLRIMLSDATAGLSTQTLEQICNGPVISTPGQAAALRPAPGPVPLLTDPALIDALPRAHPAAVSVLLSDPTRALTETDPDDPRLLPELIGQAARAILLLAGLSDLVPRLHSLTLADDPPAGACALARAIAQAGASPVHVLSHDLHRAQSHLRAQGRGQTDAPMPAGLRAPAQAVSDALAVPQAPLGLRGTARIPRSLESTLTRCAQGMPLYAQSARDHHRDTLKRHLLLWPRTKPVRLARPVGVFLHLYYHDLAPVFARRLSAIDAPVQVYVSTDSAEKADQIRDAMPDAQIRVLPNRGRDIWPKLYGFADACDAHDIVLHLHGKRSVHSDKLDDWLAHILDCLLPDRPQVNRILSFFADLPRLGIIAPLTYRPVLGAAHWATNRPVAQELARRAELLPLPGNDTLRFPVGSMFWARSQALRPLIDLNLPPQAFPPEVGQLDGTTAHALERLLGVGCAAQGLDLLQVAPNDSRLHRGHQIRPRRNGALRDLLDRTGAQP